MGFAVKRSGLFFPVTELKRIKTAGLGMRRQVSESSIPRLGLEPGDDKGHSLIGEPSIIPHKFTVISAFWNYHGWATKMSQRNGGLNRYKCEGVEVARCMSYSIGDSVSLMNLCICPNVLVKWKWRNGRIIRESDPSQSIEECATLQQAASRPGLGLV